MENWIELTDDEYQKVWDKVYQQFRFKPSTNQFPSFEVSLPYITYDISTFFWNDPEVLKLGEKSLLVFQQLVSKDEYMYALDWHHPGYWINPYLDFSKDEFDEWIVPIFPDGDYYFFIHKEFKWGFLGHPWEKTITLFGEELIEAFKNHKPAIFHKVLRKGIVGE